MDYSKFSGAGDDLGDFELEDGELAAFEFNSLQAFVFMVFQCSK